MHLSPCMARGGAPTAGWMQAQRCSSSGQSTNGWGAIYFSPSGARACFRAQVPAVLQQCCTSRDYILLVGGSGPADIHSSRGARPVRLLDLLRGQHSSGARPQHRNFEEPGFVLVVGFFFWLLAAKRGLFVSFQRATSLANLSDKVSRGDHS